MLYAFVFTRKVPCPRTVTLRTVVPRLDYLDDLCGAPLLPKEARHRRGAAPPRPRKTETGADGLDVELYAILGSHHDVCQQDSRDKHEDTLLSKF